MLWVVQEDLFCENRRWDLVNALERLQLPYQMVSVANGTTTPEVVHDGPIITNGSIMLSKIAAKRGWKPGSFLNENFSYEVWFSHYRNWLLNKDAVFTTITELKCDLDKAFIRPVLDDKSFNGKVFTRDEYLTFQEETIHGKPGLPNQNTRILVASPKVTGQEHRHYIVNGTIVTSSRYKLGGVPNFKEGADQYILDFVNDMIGKWCPATAFVLDTYVANDTVGIVEMGCLCNAGLYQADVLKLVAALDELSQCP